MWGIASHGLQGVSFGVSANFDGGIASGLAKTGKVMVTAGDQKGVLTTSRKAKPRGALTDTKAKQAKATEKAYKLTDGNGLYLRSTRTARSFGAGNTAQAEKKS